MAVVPVLILLFAGWMFWGWMVSEHRDIAWMKKWCAILFITTAMLICIGGGVGTTLVLVKKKQRADLMQFARAIEAQLRQGKTDEALRDLQSVIDAPDEWSSASSDPLKRMVAATERMQDGKTTTSPASQPPLEASGGLKGASNRDTAEASSASAKTPAATATGTANKRVADRPVLPIGRLR